MDKLFWSRSSNEIKTKKNICTNQKRLTTITALALSSLKSRPSDTFPLHTANSRAPAAESASVHITLRLIKESIIRVS